MSRRRRDDSKISFFSFQDIITSIAGILIFVALLMILDVTTAAISPHAIAPTPMQESLDEKIERARTELEATEQELKAKREHEKQELSSSPTILRHEIEEIEKHIAAIRTTRTDSSSARAKLDKEIAEAKKRLATLQAQIRELAKAKTKIDAAGRRVTFTIPGQDDGKGVVVVEASGEKLLYAELGGAGTAKSVQGATFRGREDSLVAEMGKFAPDKFNVLVLIKPSAFDSIRFIGTLHTRGYRIGWEPLEEERTALTDAANR